MLEKESPKKLVLLQTSSGFGRKPSQFKTLVGLGLGKIGKNVTLIDNPSTRGMVKKVSHLVRVLAS